MGVTLAQALGAYTHGGAVAHGDDDVRGSLTPGKLADFTRLGADPFATELSVAGRPGARHDHRHNSCCRK